MRYIEVTCRYFMKHRREQKEVFLANQRDFEIGITAFFELKRCVQSAETAAEDEDTIFHHGYLNIAAGNFPGTTRVMANQFNLLAFAAVFGDLAQIVSKTKFSVLS